MFRLLSILLQAILVSQTLQVFCFQFQSKTSGKRMSNTLMASGEDAYVIAPSSIQVMMAEAGFAMSQARKVGLPLGLVDVPLPVTGGTELDDWPGGIKQKYSVLRPMITVVMKSLEFPFEAYNCRNYLGKYGEDDAVGLWEHGAYSICCFPTTDSIPDLNEILTNNAKYALTKASDTKQQGQQGGGEGEDIDMPAEPDSKLLAIVNPQMFLDRLSSSSSKRFLESAEIIYQVESLNMRGPGALPVRGLQYRKFPGPFRIGRRLDDGNYVLLKEYDTKPSREQLETLFFEDSKVRDKDVGFLERIRRQIPQFGN